MLFAGLPEKKIRSLPTPVRSLLFILFAALLAGGVAPARAEVKAHSASTSRQFIVYGADVRLRGAMSDLAERTKAGLLQVLGQRDEWKTPLVINLDFPQANLPELVPTRLDFSQTGSGLKLQLNLLVTNDLQGAEVQRELLRSILIEMIYRQRSDVAAGSHYVAPPDWLVDGLLQLAPGHDTDPAALLLESMVTSDRITPVEEIVAQKRALLDPTSRKMHDAYAMALVQLLLDSADGRHKLAQYLQDLPDAPNDPTADLRRHFPTVLGKASGRWWSLSVARLSATNRYEILSAAETAKRLNQLTAFTLNDRAGAKHDYDLAQFSAYLKLPGSRSALQGLSQQLLLLAGSAHPSYRAVVQEYYQLALLLARGKTKGLSRRFIRVVSYRAVVETQGRDMDDYLNWFEATQLRSMSGAFSEILKNATEEEPDPPRRRDPISVYLDSIEATL